MIENRKDSEEVDFNLENEKSEYIDESAEREFDKSISNKRDGDTFKPKLSFITTETEDSINFNQKPFPTLISLSYNQFITTKSQRSTQNSKDLLVRFRKNKCTNEEFNIGFRLLFNFQRFHLQ